MTPVVALWKRIHIGVAGSVVFVALLSPFTFAASAPKVSLVAGEAAARPIQHGLQKPKLALQQKGVAVEKKPFTTERALSLYTFNRAYWESRFYDEA
jgi:hypothetical protein